MKKIYEVNYIDLSDEEKSSFVGDFAKIAAKSFDTEPLETSWLAQLLIFSRSWNSYQHMDAPNGTPEVIPLAIEMLWDYLDNKVDLDEFRQFQEGLWAAILFLNTGDRSEIGENQENSLFFEQYFSDFNEFFGIFLESIGVLLESIVRNAMEWYPVENLLYGDIGDLKIEYFEEIPRPTRNTPSQNEASTMEIYRSKTFCQVVDFIQQDMREALRGCSIDDLRKKYKEEYLFDPEVCKTIVDGDYSMEEEGSSLNLSGEILSGEAKPFSADSLVVEVMPNAVYYGRNHREQWTLEEEEEVTLETIQNLCSDLFRNEIERLELFWTNTNEASESINSRSLILINHRYPKLFPKGTIGYTCYCFDHLLERKYTLISLPDVYKEAHNEEIELLRSKFGRFPVYIIHKETNKLYPLLNNVISDVSNLSKELV